MSDPRPAVVSLELLFDPWTEARIRAEWEALAAAGLSSLAAHTAPSNRPHVTLLVRPRIPDLSPEWLAEAFALPVPVTIGAPVLFGSGERRVLARTVVPSRELLRLHAAVHELAGAGSDAPHSRPGEWTPHVTLARRMRVGSLGDALRILDGLAPEPAATAAAPAPAAAPAAESAGPEGSPVGSAFTELRRWDSASATVTPLLTGGC